MTNPDREGPRRQSPAARKQSAPARPPPPEGPAPQRLPVPWHFKLIAGFAGLYIALRVVQMLGWIGVTVKELHNGVALALIGINAVAAFWGLLAWWQKWRITRGFKGLALLGWYLYLPQILLGLALYVGGHRAPVGWQHYVYGIGAVLAIGAGSLYRRRLQGREAMLYGLVALFLTGIAVRAFLTGHS